MVDIVIPVKHLDRAKSRLRGAHPDHRALVLAVVRDTVTAAVAASAVRTVLVVCEDERVVEGLAGTGAECVDERGLPGLNATLRFGARLLRERDPDSVVAALQADLPALRPGDLDAAIAEAAGRRAFVPDHEGTGTVLLLSAPGGPLMPRFGVGSAARHAETAVAVGVHLAALRHDVDTPADLAAAAALGVGRHTAAL
ncbi:MULTISPECIES: 2-phospho-L-lactate guanylyltransferase [Actinokineospora]|uniref:Phosphoenolpyruvate guanylyltransferase n=1 Tax=Actinokineospora fastidiosa TaxID=1816 RepID=A0A918LHJ9_9PSEU|nr:MULTISPECIES: 2-phospho-L-lactate guanylyltransferase [Actinokineospora]UVS81199.1 2-phospho-L-lactate guanylyltransferase [Actinokineospora sp. UTMC 2448]GGS51992.1 2-phospho-L-lactate guanylyltransferase [Actinokineospora fastidiosa]